MSDRELHRALARATGEFVETIQRLGFRLEGEELRDEPGPQVLDWDRGECASLSEVLSDDDWPGRVSPLPSHDEEFDEEYACAAA
jgi:hypothetical protein